MTEETRQVLSIIGSVIVSILYFLMPRSDDKLRDEARKEKERLPEILQELREYRAGLEMKRLRMTATRIYVLHKPRKMTKTPMPQKPIESEVVEERNRREEVLT